MKPLPWSHYKQHYSDDFIMVRHAIFLNFVSSGANIIEEDLDPAGVVKLIQQVGQDYLKRNKRGIDEFK